MTITEAIEAVDRRQFLPADMADIHGIDDFPIPFADGQTVPTAAMTRLFCEIAHLEPNHVVMEVGTGSGYQAAILSRIVKEVHSFEVRDTDPRLTDILPDNVTLYHRDAVCDIPAGLRVDRILVTCAVPGIYRKWRNVLEPSGIVVAAIHGGEICKFVLEGFRLADMGPYAYASFVDVYSHVAAVGLIDEDGL